MAPRLPGIAVCLALAALSARAEVTTDGSLGGTAGPVAGGTLDGRPVDYLIGPELGAQRGGNLFHSFGAFSIEAGRVAGFTGPAEVQHIVSRVTGGAASQIDGTLRSNIPGADLYLVNPAGVMFGNTAQLEVRGAVWVSTADALRLADGETFAARADAPLPPLAIAAPESFGFLSSGAAPIEVDIANNLLTTADLLQTEAGNSSIGLVAGGIEIASNGASPGYLWAPESRVALVAVSSDGSAPVWVSPFDLESESIGVEGPAVRGDVSIVDDAVVSSSGVRPNGRAAFRGAGDALIWGRSLTLRDGEVRTETPGTRPGGDVRIDLSEDLTLTRIDSSGTGIRAGTGVLVGGLLFAATGDGGDIVIQARRVTLDGGATLSNSSLWTGNTGEISIDATESVEIRGRNSAGERSGVFSRTETSGTGGRISVRTPVLRMSEGGALVAETIATEAGGDIEVEVGSLFLDSSARVDSSTRSGAGAPGGSIRVRASNSVQIAGRESDVEFSGITTLSQPEATGSGGTIEITTPFLLVTDGAEISARALGAGGAGSVTIDGATEIQLLRGGSITTDAQTAEGGGITISAAELVYLLDSRIETSVAQGTGGGGDIDIDPEIVALNRGIIRAGADLGDGGNIRIVSGQFVATPDSVVDARNSLGISGQVVISAPDADLSGKLAVLPAGFADPSELLRSPCAARAKEGSSFVVTPPGDAAPRAGFDAPDAPLDLPPACPIQ